MASLSNILDSRKKLVRGPGGQLSEETPESVATLSSQAGLPSPPTTAVGAGGLGITQKQEDMLGSKAQKANAINIASQPNTNLADALRRQQARTQGTQEEEQAIQKSQNLQNLGGLGDRVFNFIESQRQKLTSAQAQAQAAGTLTNAQGQQLDSAQSAQLKPLLQQLAQNPADMNLQLQVNQALGYDGKRQLSPEEINNLYQTAVQSISQSGAEAIDDNLTASDLIAQGDFGYTPEDLADLLGMPVEQVGGMTVGQIRAKVQEAQANEFNKVNELEGKAVSGQLGAAERALARQGAREASAVGTRSSEADVANLEDQIAKAEQVSFGGQVMSIEEALSDDNITRTITDYLNAAPGSPQRTQLEQSEPQLAEFIKRNEAVLDDAAKALSAGAGQFQQLQTSNKAASTLNGLLSDDFVRDVIPGFGELSATGFDPNSVPLLAATQNMGQEQKQQYAQNIQGIANQFPEAKAELGSLSQSEIAQLQLDNPNGKWKNYVEEQRKYQEIVNTPDDDIIGLLGKVFDIGPNANFEEDLRANAALSVLGIGKPSSSLDIIDSNRDGIPDSPAEIKARLIKGAPSLKDTLAGKQAVSSPAKYSMPQTVPAPDKRTFDAAIAGDKAAIQSSLSKRLSEVAADGNLTADDLDAAYSRSYSTLSDSSLKVQQQELKYLLSKGQLDENARKQIGKLQERNVRDITAKFLDRPETEPSFYSKNLTIKGPLSADNLAKVNSTIDSLDRKIAEMKKESGKSDFYDKITIQRRISELEEVRDGAKESVAAAKSNKPVAAKSIHGKPAADVREHRGGKTEEFTDKYGRKQVRVV